MSNKSPPPPPLPSYKFEYDRAKVRRTAFDVKRVPTHNDAQWALAFSGGGIRSATFCLGVLQGLAKSARPPLHPKEQTDPSPPSRDGLLPQFDYLSTVSGGGFTG